MTYRVPQAGLFRNRTNDPSPKGNLKSISFGDRTSSLNLKNALALRLSNREGEILPSSSAFALRFLQIWIFARYYY